MCVCGRQSRESRGTPYILGSLFCRWQCNEAERRFAQDEETNILFRREDSAASCHMFLGYRPQQDIRSIVQWLKGASSRVLLQEFAHLRKQLWGRHLWGRGCLAVSSGNITDAMIKSYIAEQEGEPVHDDGQFLIDDVPPKANLPSSRR